MILLLAAATLACERALDNPALRTELRAALRLYEEFEVPEFVERARDLEQQVACTSELLDPTIVAELHLVVGLLRWRENARDKAAQAWAAARRADPAYQPSERLLPADSPEWALWEGVAGDGGATRPLPGPPQWQVDGRPSLTISTERPSVVQATEQEKLIQSAYSWPGDPWPSVAAAPPRRVRAAPLVAGGVALAAVGTGAVLFGGAYDRSQDDDFVAQCPDLWRSGACPATVSDEFRSWFNKSFMPAWYSGITLMGVGGAGLVGSGIWLAVGPTSVQASGNF